MKKTEREVQTLWSVDWKCAQSCAYSGSAISSGNGFEALRPNSQSKGFGHALSSNFAKFTVLYSPSLFV